jgi:hypothetical protein
MPTTRFRQYAAECLARAQQATTAAGRASWLKMAQDWQKSSEQPAETPAPAERGKPDAKQAS